jgi:two-component system response regulator AtoC
MSPAPQRILIVDDEPNMLHMLGALLKQEGLEPVCASSAQEALQILERESFDYVLSDVRMPGMDGIQLVENLRARSIDAIVILMSAYGNVDLAMEAIRKGAYDYIAKPFKTDEVVLTLRKAAERERLRREVIRLKRRLRDAEAGGHIVAESPAMKSILATIDQTARFESSVLITGESGTGKELIAREIHRRSGRAEGPFVAINCTALPEGLLESELFGHARGAFTGAVADKPGLFEEADGGSLLLDEIGAVQPSVQSKLLRVLDSGRIRRVGENQERTVSVRILAATNEDLEAQKRNGLFREDLYYRLSVIHFHIPPLRARREDIVPLVGHFVGQFNEKMRLKVKGISREAQDALLNAPWKGNVRELQNVIERAMILCAGSQITLDCLPHDLRLLGAPPAALSDENDNLSVKRASRSLERNLIIKALNRTGGNRSQAAELLEISYPSLLQKIKDYGLT